jgi:hypothetical protein
VSVGIDHDTAEFAANAIGRWHETMGYERYPTADRLMITADGGGSNGSRVRLWKMQLQKFADATGLTLVVCHYPPGTSKWNKIEHRLFCHIKQNWRGRPLTSRTAMVELIAATTTKTGLKVRCELDTKTYPKGIKVSDAEMADGVIHRRCLGLRWCRSVRQRGRLRRCRRRRLLRAPPLAPGPLHREGRFLGAADLNAGAQGGHELAAGSLGHFHMPITGFRRRGQGGLAPLPKLSHPRCERHLHDGGIDIPQGVLGSERPLRPHGGLFRR